MFGAHLFFDTVGAEGFHSAAHEQVGLIQTVAKRVAGIAKRDAHNAARHADKVRTMAEELLVLAEGRSIDASNSWSPAVAKIYTLDARQKRASAAELLARIGLTTQDIDLDAVVQNILARAA